MSQTIEATVNARIIETDPETGEQLDVRKDITRSITFDTPIVQSNQGNDVLAIKDFLGLGTQGGNVFNQNMRRALEAYQQNNIDAIAQAGDFEEILIDIGIDDENLLESSFGEELGRVGDPTLQVMLAQGLRRSVSLILQGIEDTKGNRFGEPVSERQALQQFANPDPKLRVPPFLHAGGEKYIVYIASEFTAQVRPPIANSTQKAKEIQAALQKIFRHFNKEEHWELDGENSEHQAAYGNMLPQNQKVNVTIDPRTELTEDLEEQEVRKSIVQAGGIINPNEPPPDVSGREYEIQFEELNPDLQNRLIGHAYIAEIDPAQFGGGLFVEWKLYHSPTARPEAQYISEIHVDKDKFDLVPKGGISIFQAIETAEEIYEKGKEIYEAVDEFLERDFEADIEGAVEEGKKKAAEAWRNRERTAKQLGRNIWAQTKEQSALRAFRQGNANATAARADIAQQRVRTSFPANRRYETRTLRKDIEAVAVQLETYNEDIKAWERDGGRFVPPLDLEREAKNLRELIPAIAVFLGRNGFQLREGVFGDELDIRFSELQDERGIVSGLKIEKIDMIQPAGAGLNPGGFVQGQVNQGAPTTLGVAVETFEERPRGRFPFDSPRTMGYFFYLEDMLKETNESDACDLLTGPFGLAKQASSPAIKFVTKYTFPVPSIKPSAPPKRNKLTRRIELMGPIKNSTDRIREGLLILDNKIKNGTFISARTKTYNAADLLPLGELCTLEELFNEVLNKFDLKSLFCEYAGCIGFPFIFDWNLNFVLPTLPKFPTFDILQFIIPLLEINLFEIIIRFLCGLVRKILDMITFPDCQDLFDALLYGSNSIKDFLDDDRQPRLIEAAEVAEDQRKAIQAMEDFGVARGEVDTAAISALFEDISRVMLPAELCALLNGEPLPDSLTIVKQMVFSRQPQLAPILSDDATITSFFENLGSLLDPGVCERISQLPPIVQQRDLCPNREIDLRGALLDGTASPAQVAQEIINAQAAAEVRVQALTALQTENPLVKLTPPLVGCGDTGALFDMTTEPSLSNMTQQVVDVIFQGVEIAFDSDVAGYVPALFEIVAKNLEGPILDRTMEQTPEEMSIPRDAEHDPTAGLQLDMAEETLLNLSNEDERTEVLDDAISAIQSLRESIMSNEAQRVSTQVAPTIRKFHETESNFVNNALNESLVNWLFNIPLQDRDLFVRYTEFANRNKDEYTVIIDNDFVRTRADEFRFCEDLTWEEKLSEFQISDGFVRPETFADFIVKNWITTAAQYEASSGPLINFLSNPLREYIEQVGYLDVEKGLIESINTLIVESPFFDPSNLSNLDKRLKSENIFIPETNCFKKNPGLLNMEEIKKEVKEEQDKAQCLPENQPQNRDFSKMSPMENATLTSAVKILVRLYVLEFVLKGIFPFSQFSVRAIAKEEFVLQFLLKDIVRRMNKELGIDFVQNVVKTEALRFIGSQNRNDGFIALTKMIQEELVKLPEQSDLIFGSGMKFPKFGMLGQPRHVHTDPQRIFVPNARERLIPVGKINQLREKGGFLLEKYLRVNPTVDAPEELKGVVSIPELQEFLNVAHQVGGLQFEPAPALHVKFVVRKTMDEFFLVSETLDHENLGRKFTLDDQQKFVGRVEALPREGQPAPPIEDVQLQDTWNDVERTRIRTAPEIRPNERTDYFALIIDETTFNESDIDDLLNNVSDFDSDGQPSNIAIGLTEDDFFSSLERLGISRLEEVIQTTFHTWTYSEYVNWYDADTDQRAGVLGDSDEFLTNGAVFNDDPTWLFRSLPPHANYRKVRRILKGRVRTEPIPGEPAEEFVRLERLPIPQLNLVSPANAAERVQFKGSESSYVKRLNGATVPGLTTVQNFMENAPAFRRNSIVVNEGGAEAFMTFEINEALFANYRLASERVVNRQIGLHRQFTFADQLALAQERLDEAGRRRDIFDSENLKFGLRLVYYMPSKTGFNSYVNHNIESEGIQQMSLREKAFVRDPGGEKTYYSIPLVQIEHDTREIDFTNLDNTWEQCYRPRLMNNLFASEDTRFLVEFVFPIDRLVSLLSTYSIVAFSSNTSLDNIFGATKLTIKRLSTILQDTKPFGSTPVDAANDELARAMNNSMTTEGPNSDLMGELGGILEDFFFQLPKMAERAVYTMVRGIGKGTDPAYKQMKEMYDADQIDSLTWESVAHSKLKDDSSCKIRPISTALPYDIGYALATGWPTGFPDIPRVFEHFRNGDYDNFLGPMGMASLSVPELSGELTKRVCRTGEEEPLETEKPVCEEDE